MAVSIQNSHSEYLATGSVNETFAITFDYSGRAGENIDVELNDLEQPRGDYDIVAAPAGATPPNITGYFVRFKRVLTLNARVRLSRITNRTQLFNYTPGLNLSSFDIINSLDKLTRISQEQGLTITTVIGGEAPADWALLDNPDAIPSSKLGNARDYMETWAVLDSEDRIPLDKLPELDTFILPWAQFGDVTNIPEGKLQLARNFTANWARTDLNVQIPADKLDNAALVPDDRVKLASLAVARHISNSTNSVTLASLSARSNHIAVELDTNKVLIHGGTDDSGNALSDAYVVTFVGNVPTVNLVTLEGISARSNHVAARLEDNKVLIHGGTNGNVLSDAYVITFVGLVPRVTSVDLTGISARSNHVAVQLEDNKVLIHGGSSGNALSDAYVVTFVGLVPTTTSVTLAGISARSIHVAVYLDTNKVLIHGGFNGNRLSDAFVITFAGLIPTTNPVTLTGISARYYHVAVRIEDNKVLIHGGSGNNIAVLGDAYVVTFSGLIPATTPVTLTGISGRHNHTAVQLNTNKVLINGGAGSSGNLSDAYLTSFGVTQVQSITPNRLWNFPSPDIPSPLTGLEIKTLYEGVPDTNALNDIDFLKLASIAITTHLQSSNTPVDISPSTTYNDSIMVRLSENKAFIHGGTASNGRQVGSYIVRFINGVPLVTSVNLGIINRSNHAAARLEDDKILIHGGRTSGFRVLSDAYVITFAGTVPTTTPVMLTGISSRQGHIIVRLEDNKVLIQGGNFNQNSRAALSDAFVVTFEGLVPTTTPLTSILPARYYHIAVRLAPNKVFIHGGRDSNNTNYHNNANIVTFIGTIPTVTTIALTGISGRHSHVAARLSENKIFIHGGLGRTGTLSDAYVVSFVNFTPTILPVTLTDIPPMRRHTAVRLSDNRVMVNRSINSFIYSTLNEEAIESLTLNNLWRLNSVEVKRSLLANDETNILTNAQLAKLEGITEGAEPNVNADWSATSGAAEILNKPPDLSQDNQLKLASIAVQKHVEATFPTINTSTIPVREGHIAVRLAPNKVLIHGGRVGVTYLSDAYVVTFAGDVPTITSVILSGLGVRAFHVSARLEDNKVLIHGGLAGSNNLSDAFVITFVGLVPTVTSVNIAVSPRYAHVAVHLGTNKVLIHGGFNVNRLSDAFVITFVGLVPTTTSVTLIGISARTNHVAVYLDTNKVLIHGGDSSSGYISDAYVITFVGLVPTTTSVTLIGISSRRGHVAAQLDTNKVLIHGGYNGTVRLSDAFVITFNGLVPTVTPFASTVVGVSAREGHIAVPLSTGRLFIHGGYNRSSGGSAFYLTTAYLFSLGAYVVDSITPDDTWVLAATGVVISGGEDITDTQKFLLEDNGRVRLYGFRIAGGTNIFGYAPLGSTPVSVEVAGGQLANAPASLAALYYDVRQGGRWHFRVEAGTKQLKDIETEGVQHALSRTSTNVPNGRSWGNFARVDIYSSENGSSLFNEGSENIKVRHTDDTYYIGKAEAYVTDRVDRVKENFLRDVNSRVTQENTAIAAILRRLDLLDPKTLTTEERNAITLLRQYAITVSTSKMIRPGITILEEMYGTYTHNDASSVVNTGSEPKPAFNNSQVFADIGPNSNTTGSALQGAFEIDNLDPDATDFLFCMNYVHSLAPVVHTNILSVGTRPMLHIDGATSKLQVIPTTSGTTSTTETTTILHLIVNARTMKDEFGIGGTLSTTVTGRHNISVAISNTFGASGFGPVSNFVISNLNTDANTGWLQFATLTYSRTNPQRIANFQYRYTLSSKALHFRTLDARTGDQFTIRATYNETETRTIPTGYDNFTNIADITSGNSTKIVGRVDTVNSMLHVSINGGALVSVSMGSITPGDITFGGNSHDFFQSPVLAELTSDFNNDDIQAISAGYPVHNNEPTSLKILVGQHTELDIPTKSNTIRDITLSGRDLTITKDNDDVQTINLPAGGGTVVSDLVVVRAAAGDFTRSVTLPTTYTNYDFVHISYIENAKLISFTVDTKELTKGSNRFLYTDTNILDWTFSTRVISVISSDSRFGITGVYLANSGSRGATGDTGGRGGLGPKGDKGAKGDTGDTGGLGGRGPKGDLGGRGPKGDKGAKGDKGDIGPQGPAGSGSGTTLTAINHYVHLGSGDLGGTATGLVTGAGNITADNVSTKLRFTDGVGSNVPSSGSYSSATGNIILPAGHWVVCASANAVSLPINSHAGTRKATVSLSIFYGTTKRHAQAIHMQNSGWSSLTYENLTGEISITGAVISDGTTPMSIQVQKQNQNSGNSIQVRGAHIHAYQQLIGAV